MHRDRKVSNPIANQSTNQLNASFRINRSRNLSTDVSKSLAINATCQTLTAITFDVKACTLLSKNALIAYDKTPPAKTLIEITSYVKVLLDDALRASDNYATCQNWESLRPT